jgi:Fe2+ transport system protein FeoA
MLDYFAGMRYKLRMILNNDIQNLGTLAPGDLAEITGFTEDSDRESFLYRLYEVGFLVGEKLEILNRAPVSGCPISIKIKDATYAIRREDANLIQVKKMVQKLSERKLKP